MLNRAVVRPDPAVFIGMAATTMEAAVAAVSADDLFLRLEDEGIRRIHRCATMAKTPTLAQWELDRLRTIDRVVRLGHVRRVEPERMVLRPRRGRDRQGRRGRALCRTRAAVSALGADLGR